MGFFLMWITNRVYYKKNVFWNEFWAFASLSQYTICDEDANEHDLKYVYFVFIELPKLAMKIIIQEK